MNMKPKKYILLVSISMLFLGTPTVNAQILRGILKACGVSDESPWMSLADIGDQAINATSAKIVNTAIETYGQDAKNRYDKNVSDYNARKDREVQQYLDDTDKFKMEYCKSHGQYDLWVQQYGNNWYNMAGRDWFDRHNEGYIRRGDNLLPWHLRGDAREETRYDQREDFTSTVLGSIGLSIDDVNRANRWTTGDKYDKQDMVIDAATNVIAGFSPENEQLINAMGQLAKVNNQYNKDRKTDKTAAITKRNIDLANIVFNAAWDKNNEKRNHYISERLDIPSVLSDAGFEEDNVDANNLASIILSIQNDDSMTQDEKNEWYQDMGIQNGQAVMNLVKEINKMSDEDLDGSIEKGPSPEEIAAKEEAERVERERIAKENAIESVQLTVIDEYAFDDTDLNNEQKEVLDRIAEVLSTYADLSLQIKGHTCDIGYKSVNDRVGLRRADTAKAYLIDKGISSDRISTTTGGENEPLVENNSSENRRHNRRITFSIQ